MNIFDIFNTVLYMKLHPDMLTVREVSSGYEISGPPAIAISQEVKKRVLAIGNEAVAMTTSQEVEVLNPFKHPRTLVSDFTVAEVVLKQFVKKASQASRGGIFRFAPIIVFHPLVNPEGGFTQIETRAMHELMIASGARKSIIWMGRELSKQELISQKFGTGGEVLSCHP